jgi:hypothetical protein
LLHWPCVVSERLAFVRMIAIPPSTLEPPRPPQDWQHCRRAVVVEHDDDLWSPRSGRRTVVSASMRRNAVRQTRPRAEAKWFPRCRHLRK